MVERMDMFSTVTFVTLVSFKVRIRRVKDAWRTIRRLCHENEKHIADASMEADDPIEIHTLGAAKLQFQNPGRQHLTQHW